MSLTLHYFFLVGARRALGPAAREAVTASVSSDTWGAGAGAAKVLSSAAPASPASSSSSSAFFFGRAPGISYPGHDPPGSPKVVRHTVM